MEYQQQKKVTFNTLVTAHFSILFDQTARMDFTRVTLHS